MHLPQFWPTMVSSKTKKKNTSQGEDERMPRSRRRRKKQEEEEAEGRVGGRRSRRNAQNRCWVIRKKVAKQEEGTQKKMKSWVQNFLKNKQE